MIDHLSDIAVEARLTMTQTERFAKLDEHNDGWHAGQPDLLCSACEHSDLPAWGGINDPADIRAALEERNAIERSVLADADWGRVLHTT